MRVGESLQNMLGEHLKQPSEAKICMPILQATSIYVQLSLIPLHLSVGQSHEHL